MIGFYMSFYIILLASSYGLSRIIFSEPFIPGLLFSFVYTHITICIQVAHVSKQSYTPWVKILIFVDFICIVYLGFLSSDM
jgi:hypothetical protein